MMDNNFNQEQIYQGYSQEQKPYQSNGYQQPSQDFARVQQPSAAGLEEPITFGDWMLTRLILCIPVVNLVMMFVWAFGNGKKSKSNIFKAELVWLLISFVLSIIMLIVFFAFFAAMYTELAPYMYY